MENNPVKLETMFQVEEENYDSQADSCVKQYTHEQSEFFYPPLAINDDLSSQRVSALFTDSCISCQ